MPLSEAIIQDVDAVGRISAVPSLLRIVCDNTGMGFAAVARVDGESWTACAVLDRINFGLAPGGQLDVNTTLCIEARAAREPVAFDQASLHPVYCKHHTPRLYNIESYISVPIIKRDGSYFGNLCAIDPAPHEVSSVRVVSLFQGFADLIAHQLELEDRRGAAEAALLDAAATAELREQFIAVLGHDLRNPLASLRALGEIVARRAADAESVRTANMIRSATRRMGGLIADVVDFARGRMGGGMHLPLELVEDLEIAFHDVVTELRTAHPSAAIDEAFAIRMPVRCNRGRLQQLLSNLLGNALVHGPAGERIAVAARTEGGWLTISVRNGGQPIDPQYLSKIFEPYWRPAESSGSGGLGLGLHICSLIVKSHAGTLEVSSSAAHGTQFVARIPCLPSHAAIA